MLFSYAKIGGKQALLKISCNKQIIMLFTPDDYSAPVKKLYSGKADNKVLVMSSDEKFIEGVE